MTKRGKCLAGLWRKTTLLQQFQAQPQRIGLPLVAPQAGHPKAKGDASRSNQHNRDAKPAQLRAKELFQPGALALLIKAQPPLGPGQIKAPPLPLQPLPLRHRPIGGAFTSGDCGA